jgi:sensor histidine kinase regulating citrate/malate metabolism
VPTAILVSPVHLNIIFSNTLDNAIEACRRLPSGAKRYIALELKIEGRSLYIRIKNSSLPVEMADGELPVTSKRDKLRNGLGLATVKRLIEQYAGVMLCEYKDEEFVFFARISNISSENA